MSREAMQQALEALQSKRFTACGWRTECDKAITALRTALAEQVQPAYWGVFEGGNLHDFFTVREMAEEMAYYKGGHAVVGPIYTTPPAPQPLTDEEILLAVGWERAEMYMKMTLNFPVDEAKQETLKNARAVERALEKKNGR